MLVRSGAAGTLPHFDRNPIPNRAAYSDYPPLARRDAELFQSIMQGDHCLRGFSNRDIRQRPALTPHLRSAPRTPKKPASKSPASFAASALMA